MSHIASSTVPGREYVVKDGQCNCPGFTYRKHCRHIAILADLDEREREIMERAKGMTAKATTEETEAPILFEHKNIHEAMVAAYRDCGYVQKQRTPGLNYSYAGEAALIAAIRPVLVEHQIYVHVAGIRDVHRETYARANGGSMNNVSLTAVVRFTHGPSGTSIDTEAVGEGADVGDKATNKASTGAYKYALRQTFAIETGDDPDGTPSEQQERYSAPQHANGRGRDFAAEADAIRKGDPLPPFPEPRGSVTEEWTKLGDACGAGETTRRELTEALGGTFSLPAFEAYLKGNAGRSARTLIEKAQQKAAAAT